jgi:DNA-directed RNA polymerase subunit RPC12/RpoP
MVDPASDDSGEEVLVLVCMECGKEYSYTEEPPDSLTCEKCGNTVFRSFHGDGGGEAGEDFREMTERDTNPEDGPTEITPGDLRDLNQF